MQSRRTASVGRIHLLGDDIGRIGPWQEREKRGARGKGKDERRDKTFVRSSSQGGREGKERAREREKDEEVAEEGKREVGRLGD